MPDPVQPFDLVAFLVAIAATVGILFRGSCFVNQTYVLGTCVALTQHRSITTFLLSRRRPKFPRARPENHSRFPDYSDRYEVQLDRNSIHLTVQGGIHTPRDFSGDGYVRINEKELISEECLAGNIGRNRNQTVCEFNVPSVPPRERVPPAGRTSSTRAGTFPFSASPLMRKIATASDRTRV